MEEQDARDALLVLLNELPYEFSYDHPNSIEPRERFSVVKKSNVKTVHEALWDLQEYFGIIE